MNEISKRQGLISLFFSTITSLINAIVQLLIIYFILKKYGSAFNGFVRLASAFSFFLSTADSALGVATTLLLVAPINKKDWITANEIFSTAKKNYRNGSLIWILIAILVSISYCLFVSLQAGQQSDNSYLTFKFADLKLTGTYQGDNLSIYSLVLISLIFSFRNILLSLFFNVYENVLSAVNKGGIVKVCILISEIFCFSIMFTLLNMNDVPVIIVFLPVISVGLIRGLLVYYYARHQCHWLKFYKEFNSFRLNVNSKKIAFSQIGKQVILSTDTIIIVVLMGLRIASTLSLYLLVAVNTKIIMKGFVTSFREYFIVIVARYGRISWKSYCKYELYSILVAGFTFINLAILLPYFVSAFYASNILKDINDDSILGTTKYILFGSTFSFIYALTSSLDIFNESQNVLINAKGRGQEVSKFQLIVGAIYISLIIPGLIILAMVFNQLTYAILFMYTVKLASLAAIGLFLYRYTWKYVAFNAEFKETLINLAIISIIVITTLFVQREIVNNFIPVEKNSVSTKALTPHLWKLIVLFFVTVFASITFLLLISMFLSFRISYSIIINILLFKSVLEKLHTSRRKKRAKENNIEFFEPETFDIEIHYSEEESEKLQANKKVYTIKG